MSTTVTKNDSGSEKPDVVHQDDALFRTASEAGPEKPIPRIAKVDYSGAYEKTDPKEIALVKKLDRWIMPMLWCKSDSACIVSRWPKNPSTQTRAAMYWLNYLDRNAIALARLNDLEEDLNLSSTRKLSCCCRVIRANFDHFSQNIRPV